MEGAALLSMYTEKSDNHLLQTHKATVKAKAIKYVICKEELKLQNPAFKDDFKFFKS